jgi:hypothetical protein
MHRASLGIIAIPLILLAATVAVSSTVSEDVFARDGGRYSGGDGTSQAAAVSNECLNPILDSNTIDNMVSVGNCAGTVSQQDESGSASAPITSQTANPTIELQRTTTQPSLTHTPPPTTAGCVLCFNPLSDTQIADLMDAVSDNSDGIISPDSTIEELCAFLVANAGTPLGGEIAEDVNTALDTLESAGEIDSTTHSSIESCLKGISILP